MEELLWDARQQPISRGHLTRAIANLGRIRPQFCMVLILRAAQSICKHVETLFICMRNSAVKLWHGQGCASSNPPAVAASHRLASPGIFLCTKSVSCFCGSYRTPKVPTFDAKTNVKSRPHKGSMRHSWSRDEWFREECCARKRAHYMSLSQAKQGDKVTACFNKLLAMTMPAGRQRCKQGWPD